MGRRDPVEPLCNHLADLLRDDSGPSLDNLNAVIIRLDFDLLKECSRQLALLICGLLSLRVQSLFHGVIMCAGVDKQLLASEVQHVMHLGPALYLSDLSDLSVYLCVCARARLYINSGFVRLVSSRGVCMCSVPPVRMCVWHSACIPPVHVRHVNCVWGGQGVAEGRVCHHHSVIYSSFTLSCFGTDERTSPCLLRTPDGTSCDTC